MKLYLISDNIDTQTGMRLAGIEGVVVHEREEVEPQIHRVVAMPDAAILLITEKLAKLCADLVLSARQNYPRLLIIEIPDRHGSGNSGDSMLSYIQSAIGFKI